MARGDGSGPHPVDIHVGRKVCEARTAAGYTQSDLARALGLTFQQVQKYEKGANRISASKLWDIAVFLKMDIVRFFDGLEGAAPDTSAALGVPPTKHSEELSRLATRLPVPQQRLVLEMVRSFEEGGSDRSRSINPAK